MLVVFILNQPCKTAHLQTLYICKQIPISRHKSENFRESGFQMRAIIQSLQISTPSPVLRFDCVVGWKLTTGLLFLFALYLLYYCFYSFRMDSINLFKIWKQFVRNHGLWFLISYINMNPVYLLQLKLFLRFYHISMLLPLELYLRAGVLACRSWLFLLIFLFVYFVIFVIFHLCFVISKPIQCGYICPGCHNCLKTIFLPKPAV